MKISNEDCIRAARRAGSADMKHLHGEESRRFLEGEERSSIVPAMIFLVFAALVGSACAVYELVRYFSR